MSICIYKNVISRACEGCYSKDRKEKKERAVCAVIRKTMEVEPRAYILDIPVDILLDIYLLYVSGYQMRAVCKPWLDAITNSTRRSPRAKRHMLVPGMWWEYVRLRVGRDICTQIWAQKGMVRDKPRPAPDIKISIVMQYSVVTSLFIDEHMVKCFGNIRAALHPFPNLRKVVTNYDELVVSILETVLECNSRLQKISLINGSLEWTRARKIIELCNQTGVRFFTNMPIARFTGSEYDHTCVSLPPEDKKFAIENGFSWMRVPGGYVPVHPTMVPFAMTTQILAADAWDSLANISNGMTSQWLWTMSQPVPWDVVTLLAPNYRLKRIELCDIADGEVALILKLAPNLASCIVSKLRTSNNVADSHEVFSYTPRSLYFKMICRFHRKGRRLYEMVARDPTNHVCVSLYCKRESPLEMSRRERLPHIINMDLSVSRALYGGDNDKADLSAEIDALALFVCTRAFLSLKISIFDNTTTMLYPALWDFLRTMPTLYSLDISNGTVVIPYDAAYFFTQERRNMRDRGTDALINLKLFHRAPPEPHAPRSPGQIVRLFKEKLGLDVCVQ
tara:strand:+ start:4354 stop:6042 length:1689 start_codon:yes stop_codon:yes gene_type:complete